MSTTPVSLTLEAYIPDACASCETASAICREVARGVLHNEMTVEEAGAKVTQQIGEYCAGAVTRSGGWGVAKPKCRYDEKATKITSR